VEALRVEGLQHLGAEDFARLARELTNARIIDVRTKEEFDYGHIKGAELFDVMEPDWPDWIDALDRDTTYLIYCRSGSRSYQAGLYMEQLGFTSLVNLAQGILSWNDELVTE